MLSLILNEQQEKLLAKERKFLRELHTALTNLEVAVEDRARATHHPLSNLIHTTPTTTIVAPFGKDGERVADYTARETICRDSS